MVVSIYVINNVMSFSLENE